MSVYTKIGPWANDTTPPVNAANLDHIEDGIVAAAKRGETFVYLHDPKYNTPTNGTTDALSAITTAIADVPVGGTLIMGPYQYAQSATIDLSTRRDIKIIGSGGGTVTNDSDYWGTVMRPGAFPAFTISPVTLQQKGPSFVDIHVYDGSGVSTGWLVANCNMVSWQRCSVKYAAKGWYFNGGSDNAWHHLEGCTSFQNTDGVVCDANFGIRWFGGQIFVGNNTSHGVKLVNNAQSNKFFGTFFDGVTTGGVGNGIGVFADTGAHENEFIAVKMEALSVSVQLRQTSGTTQRNKFSGTMSAFAGTETMVDIGSGVSGTELNVAFPASNFGTAISDSGTNTTYPALPKNEIDFYKEYGAVSTSESTNALAFSHLLTDLVNKTTRNGIRTINFGSHHYQLNTTVNLHDLQDVTFIFDSGPAFNETSSIRPGCTFIWTGAASTFMFDVDNTGGAGTNQNGLRWEGFWVMASANANQGYGIHFNNTNNWGCTHGGLAFPNDGSYLQRGIVTDSTNDDAHGYVAQIFGNNIPQGAIYCIGGGFTCPGGNISVTSSQTGVFFGPGATELKLGAGMKIDGGGTGAIGIDCQGGFGDFDGVNFEGFNSGVGLDVHRTVNNASSGRYNTWSRCKFVGHDGTIVPWKCRQDASIGNANGNQMITAIYVSTINMSTASADATVVPNGYGVFDVAIDYYRLLHGTTGP